MKSKISYILFVFVVVVFLTAEVYAADKNSSAGPEDLSGGQVIDKVVASIDGDPISLSDLRRYVEATGEKNAAELLQTQSYATKVLRDFVLSKMLEKESASLGIIVSDDDVTAYIEEIKRQNKVDDAGFRSILQTKGLTYDLYAAQVKEDILRSRVVHRLLKTKIAVSSEDIANYFKDHPDRRPLAGTVRLHQLVVPLAAAGDEVLRTQAESALTDLAARIKGGEALASLPEENHRDLGYVKIEELRAEYRDAVKDLSVGEPSAVVDMESGLCFFVVTAKVTEDGEVDETLRDEIRAELVNKQYGSALDKFLNEELPKKYTIEFKI